jgi:hypothetical protein
MVDILHDLTFPSRHQIYNWNSMELGPWFEVYSMVENNQI